MVVADMTLQLEFERPELQDKVMQVVMVIQPLIQAEVEVVQEQLVAMVIKHLILPVLEAWVAPAYQIQSLVLR